MKHIKPFNENKEIFVEELQDFCEMNLAYFIDEGTEVIVDTEGKITLVKISLSKSTWSNIKDHMIPFFTRLLNNYHIDGFSAKSLPKNGIMIKSAIEVSPNRFLVYPFSIEDLLKDNNPYSIKLKSPSFSNQVKLEDLVISDFQFFINNK